MQRAGASGRAHLRRGRGGRSITRWRGGATAPSSRGGTTATASATCRRFRPGSPTSRSRRASSHTVARRSDGSVVAWGDNAYGQCNVPALPAGLTYVEVAAGVRSHGGAAERRLRRRVGGQRLRPVQRSGASGRAHLRRGRGGRLVTRWRGGATAPSSRGGTTPTGSATCRRFRPGSPTSRSRRAVTHTVARRSDGSVVAWGTTSTASATFRRFRPGSPTSRSRRAAAHTVARRSDGSVVAWGDNSIGQCNVPALPAGLTYVEVAAGGWSHGGAAERRLRRRVGGQQLRPVQRSGASGRAHLRRGRGGRLTTRWRGGATAPSSRGGTTLRPVQRAGASGRAHLRRGRGGRSVTRWRGGATAPSSRGGTTTTASATCRRFRPGSPTSRSRRAVRHTVARRSDGSVVAWGSNNYGQCNVPALPAGLTYVEVAAGGIGHTVARRSDGSVVAWG